MSIPRLTPRARAVSCVLLLFVLAFAAAAERKSDLFYEILLSPLSLLGFPGTYAVAFAISAAYLICVSLLATTPARPLLRPVGWLFWLPHAGGVAWQLFWFDWHPFLTRFSPGIVLSLLFAAVYVFWVSAMLQPLWAWVRVPTSRGTE
jgi:hypothetical protein